MAIEPVSSSRKGSHILYDAAAVMPPERSFFEPQYWRAQNALLGTAEGRGMSCVFRCQDNVLVLRHYRRGGMVARFAQDRYLWTGLSNTRAWREWHLLAEMHRQGLPVPRPVAARVLRHGLVYSADLVTECLPETHTLAERLMARELGKQQWRRIGAVIRRFHEAGIYHADLNARNILLDDHDRVFIIDFDKARRRTTGSGWPQANLARLQRSLYKFKNQEPAFGFALHEWRHLLSGYADK